MTRLEIVEDAARHCRTCPRQTRVGNASVDCDGTLIPFANGLCPLSLWDHSRPIPKPEPKPRRGYRPTAIPREQWGEGLTEWIERREQQDKGVGSTLSRINTPESKAILIQLTHGTRCKCRDRVKTCDALYPYTV